MQRVFAIFLILATPLVQADTLTGRVARVENGDTLVIVVVNNAQQKIRLQGIDAPEEGQAYGRQSKEHLADIVIGRFVVVEYNKRDRNQQILGKVLLNGNDVNLEQINAGLAWYQKKHQDEQSTADRVKYSDAERGARREGRSLWGDPHPIPPWEYEQSKQKYMEEMQPFLSKPEFRGSPY